MVLTTKPLSETAPYLRRLIYGFSGVGKTTFAAQAKDPEFMDYENSAEVLRGTSLENIPLVGTKKELSNPENVLQYIRSGKKERQTLIIDSVTSMNDSFLMDYMRKVTKNSEKRDKHIALYGDFRKINNLLKDIFYELIDLPMDVVIVAHEKQLRDPESNKIIEVRPLLPPGAEASIERLVNEVFYLEAKNNLKGETERILHVNSQGRIFAKNRSRLSENKYINPTWKDVTPNDT